MIENDKIDYYLHILYAFRTYFFLNFFYISRLCSPIESFFSNYFKSPKHLPIYLLKNSMYKWTHTVQTHIVQSSTVYL